MLRINRCIRCCDGNVLFFLPVSSSSIHTSSSLAFRRKQPKPGKPPIVPPSKKVLYGVVHVPWMQPGDVKELLWRRHAYNNAMSTLRLLFKAEVNERTAAGVGVGALLKMEQLELDKAIEENQRDNERIAEQRKVRDLIQAKELYQSTLDEIDQSLVIEERKAEKKKTLVEDAIRRSEHFVTMENLDEKLMFALENPIVYNFAIDLQGKQLPDPIPTKYLTGTPTRQKGRLYDRTLMPNQEKN